jgi:hypothetical protein
LKEVFVFIEGLFFFLSTSSKLPDIERDREEVPAPLYSTGHTLGDEGQTGGLER